MPGSEEENPVDASPPFLPRGAASRQVAGTRASGGHDINSDSHGFRERQE